MNEFWCTFYRNVSLLRFVYGPGGSISFDQGSSLQQQSSPAGEGGIYVGPQVSLSERRSDLQQSGNQINLSSNRPSSAVAVPVIGTAVVPTVAAKVATGRGKRTKAGAIVSSKSSVTQKASSTSSAGSDDNINDGNCSQAATDTERRLSSITPVRAMRNAYDAMNEHNTQKDPLGAILGNHSDKGGSNVGRGDVEGDSTEGASAEQQSQEIVVPIAMTRSQRFHQGKCMTAFFANCDCS